MFKNRVKNSAIELSKTSVESLSTSSRSSTEDAILKKVEPLSGTIESMNFMKYPNLILRLIGLYHKKTDPFWLKAYSFSFCLINWFNFIRFLSNYKIFWGQSEEFSATLALKIIITMWLFSTAFNSTLIYVNQEMESRQQALVKNFCTIFESKKKLNFRKQKLKHYIVFVLAFMFTLINFSVVLVGFFGPKAFFAQFKSFLAPLHDSEWAADCIPFKIIASLLIMPTFFHTTFSYAIYLSHTFVMIEFLHVFNAEFAKFTKTSILVSAFSVKISVPQPIIDNDQIENVFIEEKREICNEEKFEEFRVLHLKLSHCVHLLDICYRQFIGITILIYIVNILLELYIVSNWSGNCVSGLLAGLYPFWLIDSFGALFVIVICAAKIHLLVRFFS